MPHRPSRETLHAFGADAEPVRLPGGQGAALRAGSIVLKPVDDPAVASTIADVMAAVRAEGFRVERPGATRAGAWVHDGWSAWTFLAGEPALRGREAETLRIGRTFHAALSGVGRPAVLDSRTHPWAVADRVAWDEVPIDGRDREVIAEPFAVLTQAKRPLDLPSSLVHGDLLGNVLFADGLPPAVIDFSPYWRPASYADAIALTDALVWEAADAGILGLVDHDPAFGQVFVRAVLFRLVSSVRCLRNRGMDPGAHVAAHLSVVALACRRAQHRRS